MFQIFRYQRKYRQSQERLVLSTCPLACKKDVLKESWGYKSVHVCVSVRSVSKGIGDLKTYNVIKIRTFVIGTSHSFSYVKKRHGMWQFSEVIKNVFNDTSDKRFNLPVQTVFLSPLQKSGCERDEGFHLRMNVLSSCLIESASSWQTIILVFSIL